MSTNIFDVPKIKLTNPHEKCRWGQSTINGKGKGHKICCFKNLSSLVENYISRTIQFPTSREEIFVEDVNGKRKKNAELKKVNLL